MADAICNSAQWPEGLTFVRIIKRGAVEESNTEEVIFQHRLLVPYNP